MGLPLVSGVIISSIRCAEVISSASCTFVWKCQQPQMLHCFQLQFNRLQNSAVS
jgi:hypothetical protein